jgi:hypothetical protein
MPWWPVEIRLKRRCELSSSGDWGIAHQNHLIVVENDTTTRPDDDVSSMRRLLEKLTAAVRHRRRLTPGSPEYSTALEAEERLVDGIWRGVSVGAPSEGDRSSARSQPLPRRNR